MAEILRGTDSYYERVKAVEPAIPERVARLEYGFLQTFGSNPQSIVRSPGRVELLGNHTDYNEGKAAGVTLNSSTIVGIAPNNDEIIRVFSQNMDTPGSKPHEIDPYSMRKIPEGDSLEWLNYIQGVVEILRARFGADKVHGVNMYVESDIPPGGGFSSSAALELAVAKSISTVCKLDLASNGLDPMMELILLAQQAETGPYVRAKTGLLDQTTSAAGGVVFIDFKPTDIRTPISYNHVDVNLNAIGKTLVVVSDKELKHNLAASGGGYNERVLECDLALQFISRYLGRSVTHLREMYELSISENMDQYSEYMSVMQSLYRDQPRLARRVLHVVQETHRVDVAREALESLDIYRFGDLMTASGKSALSEYDIGDGVPELQWTFNTGLKMPGVLGVRNMGGGFNNATLWLIESSELPRIQKIIQRKYRTRFGKTRDAVLTVNPFAVSPGIGILKTNV